MSSIDTVRTVIKELVEKRRSFTGKDVFERINNRRVRRAPLAIPTQGFHEREVSIIVRKLFNNGDATFEKYGSCLVRGSAGPILYFPLPAHAKRRIERISGVLLPLPNTTAQVAYGAVVDPSAVQVRP
jgi:hypothetical protein